MGVRRFGFSGSHFDLQHTHVLVFKRNPNRRIVNHHAVGGWQRRILDRHAIRFLQINLEVMDGGLAATAPQE